MMRVRVRRIGVRSVFLLFLVIYGLVGLLVGGGLAVLSTLDYGPEVASTLIDRLGWWSLVVFPALYGLVGGMAAAVAAILYNAAAVVMRGVRLDLRVAQEVEVEADAHRPERVAVRAREDDEQQEP